MNPGILLLSSLALLFQSLPVPSGPLRNTFVVATETVVDNAGTIDLRANETAYNGQLHQLKVSRDTLEALAEDTREKDIADSANNLIFLVTACRIQAKTGTPTEHCNTQLSNARTRIMSAINRHKTGNAWVDGPPA